MWSRGCLALLCTAVFSLPVSVGGLVFRSTQRNTSSQTVPRKDAGSLKRLHSCLQGKRIVFIGPSTSKYDYLALAYFAEYGSWPLEDQVPISQGIGPNPLYEWNVRNFLKAGGKLPREVTSPPHVAGCRDGGGTETFLRYTNSIFNKHEVCDGHQKGDWKGAKDVYNATENRIYLNGGTMLSYFQWFGDVVSPRGSFDISPLLRQPPQVAQPTCPVGQFSGSWAWSMSVFDFLTNVVQYAQPTHLVISAAFWPTQPNTAAFWDQLAKAGHTAVSQSGGVAIWRTTPERTDHARTDPSGAVDVTKFTQQGWKVYPARDIVAQLQGARPNTDVFYDFTHLRPQFASSLMANFLQTNVCAAR